MSLQPINRLIDETDRVNRDQRLNVAIGHLRTHSPLFTLEPHWFHLHQEPSAANSFRERDIHAPGLRVTGRNTAGSFNYDVSAMYQFGKDGTLDHEAFALTAEVGYTLLEHPWRPRFSAFYGYASGNKNPADDKSNRFERFFGFARPWSPDDYVLFENLSVPKLKVEFQPVPGLRIDTGYSAYFLASDTDRFSNLLGGSVFNRDTSGSSGDFVGQGVDVRVRFNLGPHVGANIGYAHFKLGEFAKKRQVAATGESAADSDFFYVELTYGLL